MRAFFTKPSVCMCTAVEAITRAMLNSFARTRFAASSIVAVRSRTSSTEGCVSLRNINRADRGQATITLHWEMMWMPLFQPMAVRDNHVEAPRAGEFTTSFSASVPAHGGMAVRLRQLPFVPSQYGNRVYVDLSSRGCNKKMH